MEVGDAGPEDDATMDSCGCRFDQPSSRFSSGAGGSILGEASRAVSVGHVLRVGPAELSVR